jgi:hypothetical protein
VPTYRLHSTDGDDLGTIEHDAGNLDPGTSLSCLTVARP